MAWFKFLELMICFMRLRFMIKPRTRALERPMPRRSTSLAWGLDHEFCGRTSVCSICHTNVKRRLDGANPRRDHGHQLPSQQVSSLQGSFVRVCLVARSLEADLQRPERPLEASREQPIPLAQSNSSFCANSSSLSLSLSLSLMQTPSFGLSVHSSRTCPPAGR